MILFIFVILVGDWINGFMIILIVLNFINSFMNSISLIFIVKENLLNGIFFLIWSGSSKSSLWLILIIECCFCEELQYCILTILEGNGIFAIVMNVDDLLVHYYDFYLIVVINLTKFLIFFFSDEVITILNFFKHFLNIIGLILI
jgi:hypothetical protein